MQGPTGLPGQKGVEGLPGLPGEKGAQVRLIVLWVTYLLFTAHLLMFPYRVCVGRLVKQVLLAQLETLDHG